MNHKRPVNLDLRTIKFPIVAIASILHRISGFILFFLIPVFLWGLATSLRSPESYAALATCLSHPVVAFIIWAFIAALIYHLLAGIRHLFMDIGIGETLSGARSGVIVVFIIAIIGIILAGVWLW
jgi:succinate dehydrogenase / fumarate reductase cytochrome b subunit